AVRAQRQDRGPESPLGKEALQTDIRVIDRLALEVPEECPTASGQPTLQTQVENVEETVREEVLGLVHDELLEGRITAVKESCDRQFWELLPPERGRPSRSPDIDLSHLQHVGRHSLD